MQEDLWQAVLGEAELTLSRGNFITWFKPTRLLRQKDNCLVVGVTNVFMKQQYERKYHELVMSILAKNGVVPDKIEYKIHAGLAPGRQPQEEPMILGAKPATQTVSAPSHKLTTDLAHGYRHGLNDRYTFDSFVVGAGNELAHAACQAVAQHPGDKYNPLFIYGGVGIGKTHLLHAVGNAILATKPSARIVYASTEQFVQEFVDALRFKKTTDFAKYYRSADVLIVDDMQFIAGKEKMQEEFFHTFNALHQGNKQIIISCDKKPQQIPTLQDRLKSRFAWGMTIDMQNPDFETRCAIIQTKSQTHGFLLPHDVLEYLSHLVQSNIRELEGVLNQLLAFCEMRGLSPDLGIATSLLGSGHGRPRHISAKQIVERTAKYFSVPMEEILGPKRDKDIVIPRQIAMYILRDELRLSFPKIARELGRKDHTTAIHSVDKISKEINFDTEIKNAVTEIKELLHV